MEAAGSTKDVAWRKDERWQGDPHYRVTVPFTPEEVRSLPYQVRHRTFLLEDVGHTLLGGNKTFQYVIHNLFDPDQGVVWYAFGSLFFFLFFHPRRHRLLKRFVLVYACLFWYRGTTVGVTPLPPPDPGYNARIPFDKAGDYESAVRYEQRY